MLIDRQARLAALSPDQSFIVQAPAGSGKTELLTQRILSLLARNAKSPESILAITFTRKAAHEMRLRLLKALHAGRDPQPPASPHQRHTWELARAVLAQDLKQGWDLLENPQRLQVMTIDALCASLVRQMPLVSEMGGVPEICEDSWHLYLSAAKKTVTELLAAGNPALQTLLLHLDNRQQKAVELIAGMLGQREQWLPVLFQCPQDEALRELLESNLAQVVIHFLEQLPLHFNKNEWFECHSLLQFAVEQAAPGVLSSDLEEVLAWPYPLPSDESSLPGWKALYAWCFTTAGTLRKSPDKRQGFPSPSDASSKEEKVLFTSMKAQMKAWLEAYSEKQTAIEAWQAVPVLPNPAYPDLQWEVLLALLQVLPHACAQLQVHIQTHSEIDFSGVAQAAALALGSQEDPSALTLKLDYQLQHILIDEFQDTSIQQFELIEKLVAGWMPGDGRSLFLVGDPMQSIYRFRQAEVGLFIRVQHQGLGGLMIQPLQLQANFRSDPSVIDWINRVAPSCFSAVQDMNLGAIPYSPSEAARDPESGTGVNLHATGDLIPCLQNLLQDERLSTIAILVRARSHLKQITAALKQAKISYQAVELELLSAQQLVQDLMSLTRALVHLADSVAWLAFLRSPCIGFSLADLTVIREKNLQACVWENFNQAELSDLSPEGRLIWSRVQPLISASLAQRMAGPLTRSVEELWLSLGGPACLEHESDLRLAESFFATLAKHEKGGTLPDFHRMEAKLNSAYLKTRPGVSRIQIMTLHKSKGLEFDAVLLPELQRGTLGRDQPLLLWERFPTQDDQALLIAPVHPTHGDKDPLYNFLRYTRQLKEAHEKGRLLYVGMTRAKRQLHLFGRLTQNEVGEVNQPQQGSLLGLLWPKLGAEFMRQFEPSPEVVSEEGDTELRAESRLAPAWVWPHELAPRFTSLTPLTEGENSVPMEEYSYEQHLSRQQGVLIHRLLYKIAIQGLELWENRSLPSLAPTLDAQCRELGICRGRSEVVQRIILALQGMLADSRGRWILQPHPEHEAEAVYGSCVIDRTFVEQPGLRWIIDYKTSADFHHSQDEQYRSQLAKYAQIFAEKGEKNIKCALYYPISGTWHEVEL